MVFEIGALVLGGLLLYFGAEWLIKGAAGLASAFGIKPLVIGLTVVAYGTSMPELVVSSVSALEGKGAIALGNVVGSNIANICLILGITALISPPRVDGGLLRRELPVLMATVVVLPLLLIDGTISRWEAAGLLAFAFAFTGWILRTARPGTVETASTAESEAEAAGAPKGRRPTWEGIVGVVGLVLLVLGGKVFVIGASGVAFRWGISERVVGLTIVAIGTSLPELAASVIAAHRGHSGIAVGNVVCSNIFNVLFILGGAALLRPIELPLSVVKMDLAILAVATILAVVALRTSRVITRGEGGLLVLGYVAFLSIVALG